MKKSPKILPSRSQLMEHLKYDAETGAFTRRGESRGPGRKKANAGYATADGYVMLTVCGEEFLAHRIAWRIFYGTDPQRLEIDHINGNRADNRICNLRLSDYAGNARNARIRKDNSSGSKGVTLRPSGKWCARLRVRGRVVFYEQFSDRDTAANALAAMRRKLHMDFCNNG